MGSTAGIWLVLLWWCFAVKSHRQRFSQNKLAGKRLPIQFSAPK